MQVTRKSSLKMEIYSALHSKLDIGPIKKPPIHHQRSLQSPIPTQSIGVDVLIRYCSRITYPLFRLKETGYVTLRPNQLNLRSSILLVFFSLLGSSPIPTTSTFGVILYFCLKMYCIPSATSARSTPISTSTMTVI